MDFAVDIINLVKELKSKRESIISNQIGRCGTSIGANINEAIYGNSKPDFIAKLHISLKEVSESISYKEIAKQSFSSSFQALSEHNCACGHKTKLCQYYKKHIWSQQS